MNSSFTKQDMNYMETYNASEGFFGIQDDPTDSSMSLMLDYGVFYEFLPMDEFESEHPNIVPLSGVEIGRNYAMLISTACGLWRYEIGDTVQFTSTNPISFVITGRTKYFINAFGEELIMDNAEKGLEAACKATGAQISDYTAAPMYMDAKAKCRHQWLIELQRTHLHLRSLLRFLMINCRKLTLTMRQNASITLLFSHLRLLLHAKTSSMTGSR